MGEHNPYRDKKTPKPLNVTYNNPDAIYHEYTEHTVRISPKYIKNIKLDSVKQNRS